MQSAWRPSGHGLGRVHPVLVDDDELAGANVALVGRADQVERARLGGDHPVVAEPAERERADPLRVAEREQLPLRERDDRVGALEPRHRARDGCRDRRGIVGDQRRDRLGVGGGAERDAIGGELGPEPARVRQVAVVADRDGAGSAVMDERLRVRPRVRAGRRVARVPDRDIAGERLQLLLVEDLRDEAHVAEHGQPAAVGDRDPRRLLAAVLEREEAEVAEPRDVALGGADAEDAAHQPCASASSSSSTPSSESPPTTPSLRIGTPPSRSTSSGAQASTAWPPPSPNQARGSSGSLDLGADARVERGLRERDREPAERDVVDERAARRRAPEELDERRLGCEVEPGRTPADLAEARLVLRAGECDRRGAGEQDHVALAPRQTEPRARPRAARRSRRPASGRSPARRSRCRARRSRRRSGSGAPRTPRPSPRSTRRAPTRSRPSPGCRS